MRSGTRTRIVPHRDYVLTTRPGSYKTHVSPLDSCILPSYPAVYLFFFLSALPCNIGSSHAYQVNHSRWPRPPGVGHCRGTSAPFITLPRQAAMLGRGELAPEEGRKTSAGLRPHCRDHCRQDVRAHNRTRQDGGRWMGHSRVTRRADAPPQHHLRRHGVPVRLDAQRDDAHGEHGVDAVPPDWNSYFPEVSAWEVNWKRQLRKGGDDRRVLNLYFNVGLPAAGVAVLIDQQGELDDFGIFDGAIIDPSTMPGGPDPLINEGKTVTHEVGHWVGLYHTFQGGCADMDLVQDTPPARAPAGGFSFCDRPYNTCIDSLGPNGSDAPDPNDNFMSYSTDPCMARFTPGQIARMHQIWDTYRA
ncbi:hypothetical protein MCOR02_006988 [Pyricularia oryzae]|nr:hypothetical protein MCOR02_006988 [Pyricularia oryzae]